MGVVEELERARATYDRGDWAAAYRAWTDVDTDALDAEDLGRLAVAAYLLQEFDSAVEALQRAYSAHDTEGHRESAARSAYWLGTLFLYDGQPALAAGWAARCERQLSDVGGDSVEHGYLAHLTLQRSVATGDFPRVAECAVEVVDHGRRFGDADLLSAGLAAMGRMQLMSGAVPAGLAKFDEAMVGILAGELSPIFAGQTYCVMIEGCQEVGDLDRAARWTEGLTSWCGRQPGLVAFTGQCAVHRGQLMRLRGALSEAVTEFDRAVLRYRNSRNPDPAGFALAERGDVLLLQGDLAGAGASFAEARQSGYEPQPGLALLWAAQGRERDAVAAVNRLLAETGHPVARARLLPAGIDVLVSAGRDAAGLVAELDELADAFGCIGLRACAALVHGRVQLAAGDPAGSLPYLRKAAGLWREIDAPLDVARVRLFIGRALELLGDHESAFSEYAGARDAAAAAGATPLRDEAQRLLAPGALPGGLTAREAEVVRLVAAGMSNTRIAAELVLSEKTVARHLANVFGKLDVGSRTAAAAWAFEQGLVSGGVTRPAPGRGARS